MVHERSDEQLLLVMAKDPAAFEEFYRRHIAKVMAFAVRRCARPEDVADLVSAVFLAAISSTSRFDPERGRAVPWLLGIAAHESARTYRRRRREAAAMERLKGRTLLDDDDHERLAARIDAARLAPRVRDALMALTGTERQMVELTSLEQLTPAEAAVALGIRPSTARMRLNRARKKLQRALGDSESTFLPRSGNTVRPDAGCWS